jgi:hypothetical protein
MIDGKDISPLTALVDDMPSAIAGSLDAAALSPTIIRSIIWRARTASDMYDCVIAFEA